MTEPSTPRAFTFQDLRILAWAKIRRHEGTAALYALEGHAKEAIDEAAGELQRLFASEAEHPITRDDAFALELVTILEYYGRSGALAARIMVDRYGMKEE